MEKEILNIEGSKIDKCELSEEVFGQKPNTHFLYEAVTAYLANQRLGSACAKTRDEVSGGGKKPWKQKGTGRARHGSTRSPLWRKGGVVFGPKPRSYRKEMPAAKRKFALMQSLSSKLAEGNLIVLDKLELSQPKTKELFKIIRSLDAGNKPLFVLDKMDNNIKKAGNNIKGFKYCFAKDLNAYIILNSSKVIITKDAVSLLNTLGLKSEK